MPNTIVLTNNKHYDDIADAIRSKNGSNTLYKPSQMAEAINALVVSGTVTLQDKTITPTESEQTVTHDEGYMGLGTITVNPILTETKTVTENGNVFPTAGKYLTRVTVNVPQGSTINNQDKSVTPTESEQSVTYDNGYTGLGTVTVGAISSTYVGSGITQRSSTDLTASGATVTVPAGYYSTQATKSVTSGSAGTPTASKGTVSNHSISVTPSVTNTTGYITGGTKTGTAVTVSASELVSGKKEITANGDNIDVTNYATVKVAVSGNVPVIDTLSVTPTESEQTFNSSSVDGYKPVTVGAISSTYVGSGIDRRDDTDLSASGATVTVPAGYYSTQASKSVSSMTLPTSTSATSSGTSKATVSRSTSDQYINIPTGYNSSAAYYKISAVANGSATNSGTASASSATVTAGTNSITLSKAVSITPTVTEGYISSGTAGNVTVSLTGSVTTKGATTYTPGTADQTISSGTYLTGTQTISGDSDLTAGNIKQGVTIFGVEGTYAGQSINNQAKSFTPDETGAEITPDTGYTGLSKVTVSAIPDDYVGSSIDRRDSTDLTASRNTINVPAGYYAEATSKAVSSGSVKTPTLHGSVAPTISVSSSGLITATTPNIDISFGGNEGYIYTSTETGTIQVGTSGYSYQATEQLTTKGATTYTPTTTAQTISSGTYLTGTQTISGDADLVAGNIKSGVTIFGVEGTYSGASINNQNKTVTPTTSEQEITADAGYTGLGTVTVEAMPTMTLPTSAAASATTGYTSKATIGRSTSDQYINIPTGYNSAGAYYKVSAVANGSVTAPSTISGTSATVSTGTNTLTLTKTVSVTPNVTTAGYISSGTAGNSDVSLTASVTVDPTPTASGATVTIPAGYYTAQTTKSVSSMTLPSSTSGTSSGTSKATITPSTSAQYLNIPTGYNSTAQYYTISAMSSMTLPSSTSSTSSGTSKATITPSTSAQYLNIPTGYNSTAQYYTISAMPSGSATGPSSLSGSSATVSTGTNTITLTKTGVTTTPTVSAGYVASATASTATVTLTASVTTKGTATITPGTTDQTIASGTYITGTQTISGDADLVAGNIKSGVTIFNVQGSYAGLDTSDATATAADIVNGLTAYADGRKLEGSLVVQKYYTGSTTPSSSLGNNGDIYFQS